MKDVENYMKKQVSDYTLTLKEEMERPRPFREVRLICNTRMEKVSKK